MDSVTGTLEPYNPQLSTHGIPAEQVEFNVRFQPSMSTPGSVQCHVQVLRAGRQLGAETVSGNVVTIRPAVNTPGSVPIETMPISTTVAIAGEPFFGTPSDAHVTCYPGP